MPLPQLTPLARREVDVVVGLDKPEAGRFVARKLTDYTLGVYASAAYLRRNGAPADIEALKRHRLIGYVEEHAFSTALDYVRELFDGAPTSFESASAVTQLEAVRAGVGLGVVHNFIARPFEGSGSRAAERRATRAYWLVTHEDTRGLGRIRALADHLAEAVARTGGCSYKRYRSSRPLDLENSAETVGRIRFQNRTCLFKKAPMTVHRFIVVALLVAASAMLGFPRPGLAADRVALVIGNGAYAPAPPFRIPRTK